ncbi:uncharacterized protein KRP23_4820 [Phytophthora ramorum]|uniref:uncharacterized protein n=1 Tax=Phytophthora ramorum TaxID=164328 RepID=UPI0030A92336|nr:hypothetical protein KRP23_4816 [Phytophthora ramorum]KAH7481642.1 hypothetical protein KRP23_4820 [Phytophthora ramorum]
MENTESAPSSSAQDTLNQEPTAKALAKFMNNEVSRRLQSESFASKYDLKEKKAVLTDEWAGEHCVDKTYDILRASVVSSMVFQYSVAHADAMEVAKLVAAATHAKMR